MATVTYVSCPRVFRDKTIADKLMYIPNNDTKNYPLCSITISGLIVWTLNLMIKVPKVIKPTNKKLL